MSQLRERTKQYTRPIDVSKMGLYPFFRAISSEQSAEVIYQGKKVLMFGSNSYLGLTNHPKVKEAAIEATRKYGSSCAGSRFLNGTLDIHVELEEKLARFLGKEAALAYSTGFQVNLGVIPTLTDKGDYILIDMYDHASIVEGSRLSSGKTLWFGHNDMESLEVKLSHCEPESFKLIVVDGVFSMEGDIAKLPEIVRLAKKYNASVMTDCAHAVGVLGTNGEGTPAHFNLIDDVELIGGTFSKSLASLGGFVAGDSDTIRYLKHHSRSLIFSASITPASVAAASKSLDIMMSEPWHKAQLWELTQYAHQCFIQEGIGIGLSETPIIPIYIRDDMKTFQITSSLLKQGIFVNPVIPPAVSKSSSMLRFSVIASHTKAHIDEAIEKISRELYKLGILPELAHVH